MKRVFNVSKPAGATPLLAIKKLKERLPNLKNEPITYAGRLDPLAEGVLILLAGEKVFEKEKYISLAKEYEAEILINFQTDSFDVLGRPKENLKKISAREIDFESMRGNFVFSLPPYSSYKIGGRPLFWWARRKKLKEIKIPEREGKILAIKRIGLKKISGRKLLAEIFKKIDAVKGDFRQEAIKKGWQKILAKKENDNFEIVKIKITCSAGFYIRSLADKSGGAVFSLLRTRVGRFRLEKSLRIF